MHIFMYYWANVNRGALKLIAVCFANLLKGTTPLSTPSGSAIFTLPIDKVSLKMHNRSRRSEYQLTKSFIVLVVSGTRLGLHVADRKLDTTNMADACKENRLEKGSVRTHCRPGDSRLRDERDTITMSTLNWLSLSTFAYTPMFLEQDENRKWIDKMRTICNWF